MSRKNPRKNPCLWMYLRAVSVVGITLGLVPEASPQGRITTPLEEFGFNLGDDYHLANYRQLVGYWRKLSQQSDRMLLEQIGTSEEGRPMAMAIVTSPENHRNLDRYKEISRHLALAEGLTDDQARQLAAEGKAVVWIDGGLHATEVLGAQQLIELVYRMVSRDDAETLRFLDDVILLAVCANPDGLDLVADWYMSNPEPTKRTTPVGPAALAEVCGRQQQPGLLHVDPVGDHGHERHSVSAVVPPDRLQPSPERTLGSGALRPALPRPVQLQPRPAIGREHRYGGSRHAQPLLAGREARRDHAAPGAPITPGGTADYARRPIFTT